jgi:uncharacterized membrane protein YphA (DoxX/SURF4 family)
LTVATHGTQKLFGWFGALRLRPAGLWAFLASVTELGGGMLMALGFSVLSVRAVVSGPGAYSLDVLLGLPEPLTSLGGLVLVLIGVALAFGTRTPAKA